MTVISVLVARWRGIGGFGESDRCGRGRMMSAVRTVG